MNIYITRKGETFGPYARHQVMQHLKEGELKPTDIACREGDTDWQPLSALLGNEMVMPAPAALRVYSPPIEAEAASAARKESNRNEVMWEGKPYRAKVLKACVLALTVVGIVFIPFLFIPTGLRYRVTRSRLIVQWGVFRISTNEVRIQDVRNINLVGKSLLFGTATLRFDVAGSEGAEVVFHKIRQPEKVRDLVRALQEG